MANYGQHVSSTTKTPQREKAREEQVENNAGGYVFTADLWARLDRWLILGAEGGSYYTKERELTRANAKTIMACLKEDGARTVARIAEISEAGRAPKNDPAIFALALAAADANIETRRAALQALPRVCRIGTHLFHFMRDVKGLRGYSRMLKTAISAWYLSKTSEKLAYDLLKYQQRDGWGHRDLIRLAHVGYDPHGEKKLAPPQHACLRWAVGAEFGKREVRRGKPEDSPVRKYSVSEDHLPAMLAAYEEMKVSTEKECIKLIEKHGFTHEMIPTEHKNSKKVWEALLDKMPMTALVRNLGKMSQVGLLAPMSDAAISAAEKLTNADALHKARVHPISLLSALRVYAQGHGDKGKLTWTAVKEITDALDSAFYMSFDAVEPSGKRVMIAIDCSGSMDWPSSRISGLNMSAREGAACMAMVTARAEKYSAIFGFSSSRLEPLNISPKQRLDDVVRAMQRVHAGGTDCSLPMLHALQNDLTIDVFQVYTDSETWAGSMHPFQALKLYRAKKVRNAKSAVIAMVANDFTMADPNDVGMMDFCGFDSAAPAVLADFARG